MNAIDELGLWRVIFLENCFDPVQIFFLRLY